MIRLLASSALLVLLAAPRATADIGPKPTTRGSTPQAMGTDMSGIEVEMAEEKVDLVIHGDKKAGDRLEVRAEFTMRNHGETATIETGFPIGSFENFEAFSIQIDGKPVKHEVVSPGEGKKRASWYVWQATYPGHATSKHVVKYVLNIRKRRVSPSYAGYVLHTGGPWKGPIGKAVVTLRCAGDLSFEQFIRFEPEESGVRHADRVVWSHADLEPTKAHDIIFYWGEKNLEDKLAEARKAAETSWASRASVVAYLGGRPRQWLRPKMTAEELTEYLDAVAALLEGARVEGERLILPKEDARGNRSYVGSPEGLLHWIGSMTKTVVAYPESDRAKALLRRFVEIGERFLAGQLYAGDVQLELPWRGRSDSEVMRARRDQALGKRRAKIEKSIEQAKEVCAAKPAPAAPSDSR